MKINKNKVVAVAAHVRHFLKKSYRENISALSGQSAFFMILSVVPLLMFVFALLSMLTGADPESFSVPYLGIDVDSELYGYFLRLLKFVEESVRRSGSGTMVLTAIVTLWSAGRGMYCITEGIARIYNYKTNRVWLFKRIFAMGYTVVMLLILLTCAALMAGNIFFAGSITALWGGAQMKWVLTVLLYLLLSVLQALMMTVALKLYLRGKIKNKRYCTVRALFPGMILTVIAWNLLTLGTALYIRHFAASSIYGSLGSVFVVMIWIYFMMYILLCGVQLNYVYRAQFSGVCRSKSGKEKSKESS